MNLMFYCFMEREQIFVSVYLVLHNAEWLLMSNKRHTPSAEGLKAIVMKAV